MVICGIEEKNKEIAERMVKVALWCVQYRQELRPMMSEVVKMLEGSLEIPKTFNPFQHLIDGTFATHSVQESNTYTTSVSSVLVNESNIVCDDTPIMRKYEIELASI
ncbi:non-specific serine/threonine protein kinase [Trifolium repens]|nr:non-specific serine/threonine protein kinase [Trifolium repens]